MKLSIVLMCAALAACTRPTAPSIAKVYDSQVANVEGEVTSLAEAMPADKFDFAPKDGAFSKVRTFGLQVRHIATVNYMIAAALLNEKNPVDHGTDENGDASLTSKDQIVKYLKDSFAYVHKAVATMTPANETETIQSPFGSGQTTRAATAMSPVWHTFDHYGQMVVYARMNGIVPPASR